MPCLVSIEQNFVSYVSVALEVVVANYVGLQTTFQISWLQKSAFSAIVKPIGGVDDR